MQKSRNGHYDTFESVGLLAGESPTEMIMVVV